MRFDWTDLRVFLHVCEAGSMTAAAGRSHLTLAAVSARMRALERSNGIALLQRHARGVLPTPAGRLLAAHARAVFGQTQQLERELLHADRESPRRTVLLANSSAIAGPALARALAARCDAGGDRPALVVQESSSEATVQALRGGMADVGIVSDAVEARGLVQRELAADPLVLVVPKAHPLAKRAGLRLREFLDEEWAICGEQSALFTHLQMRAIAQGRRIRVALAYPRMDAVLEFVARGCGLSVLPAAIVDRRGDMSVVASVPLEEPWARRTLLVCYQPDDAGPRRALADAIVAGWRS